MKTKETLALALAGLLLAGTGQAQMTGRSHPSIQDNPGVLGQGFTDLNYSWVDYHRDRGLDADGYIAGLSGNAPIARGIDVGLGYNYFRENNHRNPFTGSPYDARYHQVATEATFFAPASGVKPFVTGGVGYQWSRGDLQSLRTYDHEWTWAASGGVEMPMGLFALTPRITYSDTMRGGSTGAWHYGAQVHHWFTEKVGGYVDATFHDPLRNSGPESWTYTAGVRLRF